jgi:Restriction endonuclease XhoI
MGALELLVKDLLIEFGINESDIFTKQKLELPGYYRSTKKWDLLVVSQQQLVMAVEFKSIGGSYGNNLNNRTEDGTQREVLTHPERVILTHPGR